VPAQTSAAVIACWGDRDRQGRGEPRSVIDGKRRRLKCLEPAVLRGRRKEGMILDREHWKPRMRRLAAVFTAWYASNILALAANKE
jgi:hypothetical protein